MANENIYKKVFPVIAFLVMMAVNILDNLLPINGFATGDLFDNYPSLITPAGYTFLIWTVIHILLFTYVVYLSELIGLKRKLASKISDFIRLLFILTCLCNIAWVFAWHFRYIALSLVLIITILVCLSLINKYVYSEELSFSEKIFVRLPFGIYFGWITVVTVVNTSVLLKSISWSGFGISARLWTSIAALIIFIIASVNTLKNKSLAYAAAVIWAYVGIIVKHTSRDAFNYQYPEIVILIIICILFLLIEMGYIIVKRKKYGF